MVLRKIKLVGWIGAALLLAACATTTLQTEGETPFNPQEQPLTEEPAPATDSPSNTPSIQPSRRPASGDFPEAVESAIGELSDRLNVSASKVEVVSFEETVWRDSCLGLAGPNEMCLQALTPGFLIILESGGEQYEIHTDKSGDSVRIKEGPGIIGGSKPGLDQQRSSTIEWL